MANVSVLIATHNRAELLGQSIESVLAQTYQDWELIIIDDGSTDRTREVIDDYLAVDKRIRVIAQPNRGQAAARNKGMEVATGCFVAFLDDDDVWLPNKLEKQIAWFNIHPDAALCFTQAILTDAHLTPLRVFPESWPTTFEELVNRNRIPLPTVMVRHSNLKSLGGFDERLPPSEDYDLWLRIVREFPFGCLPEPLALYRRHGKNASLDAGKRHRACLIIFQKLLKSATSSRMARLCKRRLAQQHYALARIARAQDMHGLAAAELALAIRFFPTIGLTPPGRSKPNGPMLLRLVKPYLGVGYCLMRAVGGTRA